MDVLTLVINRLTITTTSSQLDQTKFYMDNNLDEELFIKLIQGDETAFQRFYSRWANKIIRKIRWKYKCVLGLEADDFAQSVWEKIWKTKNYESKDSFKAFIYKICHSACTSEIEKLQTKRQKPLQDALINSEIIDESFTEAEIHEEITKPISPEIINALEQDEARLNRALDSLHHDVKWVFIYHVLEELTVLETAKMLAINEDRVKYLLKLARKQLRKILTD